ncbi:MAG: nuclear transport factor 2 family protein [Emcibacter sp.]|nr:nuclear transport factor 2 family protein [Emcibacter sp.]
MDANRSTEIRQQIETLYALTAEGKWNEVENQLTDDFEIIEADSLPYGGEWKGKDSLQRLFTHVFGFWDDPSLEIHDITVSEDNAIGLLTIHATSRHNGERMAMKVAEVFHLRGDKICGITPYYFDTAAIAKATGTSA